MEKTEIMPIIEPYRSRIRESVSRGWHAYQTLYKDHLHKYSPITRANLIRDHVVDCVRTEFQGEDCARIIERPNGLFLLEIERRVFVRFKKLNSKKFSSNIPTKQAHAFLRQLPIPGFGKDRVNLNAGYTPNESWTEIDGIFITHPSGLRRIAWFIDIGEEILMQPVIDITPAPEPTRERVRLKMPPVPREEQDHGAAS